MIALSYLSLSINLRYTDENKSRTGMCEALGLSSFLSDSVLGPNHITINCNFY